MAYDYNLAPKALSEQCAAFKKKYPTLDDLPADEYIMMAKYDGCLAIITPEGVITRTGEPITSIPQCLDDAAKLLPGHVIFGEVYRYETPFKEISGAFRRHKPQSHLFVMVFDAVPFDDWKAGKCDKTVHRALHGLEGCVATHPYRQFDRRSSA